MCVYIFRDPGNRCYVPSNKDSCIAGAVVENLKFARHDGEKGRNLWLQTEADFHREKVRRFGSGFSMEIGIFQLLKGQLIRQDSKCFIFLSLAYRQIDFQFGSTSKKLLVLSPLESLNSFLYLPHCQQCKWISLRKKLGNIFSSPLNLQNICCKEQLG